MTMTLEVISKEMRAIGFDAPGGPEVLSSITMPIPVPGAGDVLIRVHAAGVNRPDLVQRVGKYPPPPGASPLLGLEVSGTVVQTGEGVEQNMLGQRVCALTNGGGYAEYVAVPAGQCLPVPDGYDMIEAAALPETLFTVWTNLFERAYAVEGDTVLVHGGTSGIGTMAITLCNLFGVKIIVTCGSDEKCRAAIGWGATHALNYRSVDYVEEVKRITGGSARHGGRRLSGAQSPVPRQRRTACLDRHACRQPGTDFHRRYYDPPPHPHRIDTAPAFEHVQIAGRRRDQPPCLAVRGEGRAAAVDGPCLSAGRGRRRACADGGGRAYRQDRAEGCGLNGKTYSILLALARGLA
jgi:hypothetical protein